jgi:predicted membrane-bound spermidine synthase
MAIFALSGFSGLIYQSIWSHYLGLTLGHAAYAQSLVLAIFMGGLALGSWLASRWIRNVANAVLAYAAIEAAIGAFGLLFHPGFVAYTGFSQDSALPALPGNLVHAYQWGTAALLILPQCVLLGMTFPLMASACLRIAPAAQGRSLGGLYFTNSFGAAIGALVATFVLLPAIGMPGAMVVAGLVNFVVAALAWSLSRGLQGSAEPAEYYGTGPNSSSPRLLRGVLLAAAITGATSFVYEVVWVRMLNMALGTTLHSFELMLAAFISGLAAGGYWIHRRGDRTEHALWLAGVSQVFMGLFALASTFAFQQSFRWVGWLMKSLPHTEAGYTGFNLGSAAIALAVMFPAAFFAGSTLPLFTMALLRRGEGERAVGRVYAANTLGAIVGVFAVVHLLIPVLGLHLSLLLAAAADIALGVVLLAWFGAARAERDKRVALLAGVAMLAVALVYGRIDPNQAASGVYRNGNPTLKNHRPVRFMADGKTATVSVFESKDGEVMTISTNGKPDAGMATRVDIEPVEDEVTMVMLGALPLAMHEHPEEVAAIGWGSGLTTHTLLGSPRVRTVETVEIEPAMVMGARNFGARVARAYDDPRSRIVYDDARSYFSAGRKHYDVLVSEPSNPWVSGVSSLFTEEFYGFASHHLKPHGLFVQWLQSYEISDELQARMIAALLKSFPHVEVYITNATDLILVASADPIPVADWRRLEYPVLGDEVTRVGLGDLLSLKLRRLGGREVLEAYVRSVNGELGHSDFYPSVGLGAPRDRFMDRFAGMLPLLAESGLPVLDVLDGRHPPRRSELVNWDNSSRLVFHQKIAGALADGMNDPAVIAELKKGPLRRQALAIERVRAMSAVPIAATTVPVWSVDIAALAHFGPGSLAREDLEGVWVDPKWLAPGQGEAVRTEMAAYRAAAMRDPASMRAAGTDALALDVGLSADMRRQMLLIAMIGAAGEGDAAGVRALDRRFGAGLEGDADYELLRRFLLAWKPG